LEPKRTCQGVHIVPVQYGTGIFAGAETGPLLDRIAGLKQKTYPDWNRLEIDPCEQSVWIQRAPEISAQGSFHTSYDGARPSSDWKKKYNSSELATFFTFFL